MSNGLLGQRVDRLTITGGSAAVRSSNQGQGFKSAMRSKSIVNKTEQDAGNRKDTFGHRIPAAVISFPGARDKRETSMAASNRQCVCWLGQICNWFFLYSTKRQTAASMYGLCFVMNFTVVAALGFSYFSFL